MYTLGHNIKKGQIRPNSFVVYEGAADAGQHALQRFQDAQKGKTDMEAYHTANSIYDTAIARASEVLGAAKQSLIHLTNTLLGVIADTSIIVLFVGIIALAAAGSGGGGGLGFYSPGVGSGGDLTGIESITRNAWKSGPTRSFRAYLKAFLFGWPVPEAEPTTYFLARGTTDITHVIAKRLPKGKIVPVPPRGFEEVKGKQGYFGVADQSRITAFYFAHGDWVYYDRKQGGGYSKSKDQNYPGDDATKAQLKAMPSTTQQIGDSKLGNGKDEPGPPDGSKALGNNTPRPGHVATPAEKPTTSKPKSGIPKTTPQLPPINFRRRSRRGLRLRRRVA